MADEHPTTEALAAYTKARKITGAKAAEMTYLGGGRQWRKYTGGESPRRLSKARLFCLVAHARLPPELIAEIEGEMAAIMENSP